MEKVIIIGSGCAGYTSAVYASRANLSPLLLAGIEVGGQLALTTEVENYPGFPSGILGPELMNLMKKQAERFGTRVVYERVIQIDLRKRPFLIKTDEKEYEAQTIIITTGSSPKKLDIPGETKYWGYGVSACATCDGAFYKNAEVVVVGGGDTAMEEATFLTKFASKVTVVHRRDSLRASKIMQDRALKNPKIEFAWNSAVTEVLSEDGKLVSGVIIKNLITGEDKYKPAAGFFLAIGHNPNTEIFRGQLDMDENGYLIADDRQHTNVVGVFAAGDVQDHRYRQAITAAGTGCAAALEAERFLAALENA